MLINFKMLIIFLSYIFLCHRHHYYYYPIKEENTN